MTFSSSKPVVLLETPWDVELCEQNYELDSVRCVALSPWAMEILDERSVPYQLPEEIVPADEIESCCVAGYEALRGLFAELDANAKIASPDGPAVFQSALWDTGAYLDSLIMRALVLDRILADSPAEIIAANPDDGDVPGWYLSELSVPHPPRLWSWVLKQMETDMKVRWLPGNSVHRPPGRASIRGVIRNTIASNRLVWSATVSLRKGMWRNAFRCAMGGRTGSVLILGEEYQWSRILPDMVKRGWRVIFDNPSGYFRSKESVNEAGNGIEAGVDEIWNHFQTGLPACIRSVTADLRTWVFQLAGRATIIQKHALTTVRRLQDRHQVKLVINAVGSSGVTQIALRAFRCLGVPVAKWQHGSVWHRNRITQRMDDSDPASADLQCTFGSGSTEAYTAAGRVNHCKIVAVGAAGLEAFSRSVASRPDPGDGVKLGGLRILYVISNYYLSNWYCGFSPPRFDGTYYRGQQVILKYLLRCLDSDRRATLTLRPPTNYFVDYPPPWIEKLPDNPQCRVADSGESFLDLLPEHDVVVIDCPTTTLLEALCTRAMSLPCAAHHGGRMKILNCSGGGPYGIPIRST